MTKLQKYNAYDGEPAANGMYVEAADAEQEVLKRDAIIREQLAAIRRMLPYVESRPTGHPPKPFSTRYAEQRRTTVAIAKSTIKHAKEILFNDKT